MSLLSRAAAVAAALAVTATAPAHASSVVYADKGNVWVATPDGAVNRAITTDGTENTPAYDQAPQGELVGPYLFPSAADDGRVIAARYRYGDGTANFFWKFMNADGSHVASNIVTMTSSCGSAPRPLGPFDARISADGGYVAFSFYCSGRSVGLNTTTGYVQNPPAWSGERVSWFGNQLIASRSGTAYAQQAAGAPLTDTWSPWVQPDSGESIGRVEVARGGGKMLFEVTVGEVQSLYFGTFSGGVPSADGSVKCKLPTAAARKDAVDDPESFSASWSPDGTMITWADSEGVKVAAVPDLEASQNGAGQTCALAAPPKVLSPTGRTPSFTPYTWTNPTTGGGTTTPGGGGGGTTTPGGTTQPPAPAGKLSGRLPASIKASALVKGVTLKLTAPGAGRLAATAKLKRRTVASGRADVAAAGAAKVKVKAPRKRARKLRGKKLVLKVTFTPATGAPSSLQRTVRVR